MALTTKRIIALPSQTDPQEGDYLAIDNATSGTHKIPVGSVGVELDDTLTEQGKAADAKATGDAIDAIRSQIEVTGTASGAIATFTDGAEMPAKSVIVNIEPQQSGSGTPSPDNVRAISGWESVNVYDTGKNMLEVSMTDGEVAGVTYTKNADGSISCNGTITGTGAKYISSTAAVASLKEGVTYVLSGGDEVSTSGIRVVSSIKNADGSVARWIDITTASGYTFTLEEGQTLNPIYLRGNTTGTAVNVTIKPMIRLASEDATFAPYNGHTTTTPLGRTVYGGTLDVVSGALTVDRAMVDLGMLTWTYVSADLGFYANLPLSKDGETQGDTQAICSAYRRGDYPNDYVSGVFLVNDRNLSSVKRVWIKNDNYTDAAAFKTSLSGQTLVYTLATPQTYQLTPAEVKTLLGENNVWADSGDVEVVYVRDLNITINNLLNNSGTRSLGMMAMSAPTDEQTDEPTDEPAEDDMR